MERIWLHQGSVFGVEQLTYTDPAGHRLVRDIVRHPGAVTVIPVQEDGSLVMIRNWRISVQRWLYEFCAGKLEPGEDPVQAARRELEEETGRRTTQLRKVGEFFTSPGFADERMHVYEARGLTTGPRRLEVGERIEVVTCTVEELDAMIRDGRMEDGKTMAAYIQWRLLQGAVQP